MSWTVNLTDQAQTFVNGLDEDDRVRVIAVMQVLAVEGPGLGRPHADVIKTSRHKNMKELRVSCGPKQFRILFAFDTERHAILLVGGDKIAHGVVEFYEEMVPLADKLFDDHLAGIAEKQKPAPTKGTGKGNKGRPKR